MAVNPTSIPVSRAHSSASAGSENEDSFSWSYDPESTPRGVSVIVTSNSASDQATGVTYGGVAMTKIVEANDTGVDEPMSASLWFLGSSVPSGEQTIVVSRNNNGTRMGGFAAAVTADADTEVYVPGVVLLEEDGSVSEQNVDDGQVSGPDSLRYVGGIAGHGSPPPVGANTTGLTSYQWQSPNQGARIARETTPGVGSRPVGLTTGTSDDRALIHWAVREVLEPEPEPEPETYSFLPASRSEPVRNRLGEYGLSFQVGKTVYIDSDGVAHEGEGFIDPASLSLRDGSGENGKSYFIGARSTAYQITEAEKDILVAAGIMDDPSA